MGNGGKIAAIFILSLFFTTLLISYFDTGFNGSSEVIIINLPLSFSEGNSYTDFKNSCNISAYETTGSWTCDANGITGNGDLRYPLEVKTQDGIYDNTYHITSHSGDFTILVMDTKFGNRIRVKFTDNAIIIPDTISLPLIGTVETGIKWQYPFDSANKDLTIHTNYDSNYNNLNLDVNGQSWSLQNGIDVPNTFVGELKWATGILSDGTVTVASIQTNYESRQTEIQTAMDGLSLSIDLIWKMIALCTYRFPYDIIPLQYQFAIIFPQEFLILVGCAMFLREG